MNPIRAACLALSALLISGSAWPMDAAAERAAIEQWRAKRLANLTSDTGWLTLAGLFWLKDGKNTFERLPGSFVKSGENIRFVARPGSGVSHAGKPVTTIEMVPDSRGEPTVLESGPLSFFVIERVGRYGVRLRDKNNPHRTSFRGLEYFPISMDWVLDARFEPYEPHKKIPITNILGYEENMVSPGAIVFTKNGRDWRLDAILEEPDAKELFVMFADTTSGRETYGAGRYMYLALPENGRVRIDFNRAYNPPCAFNDFATCPLTPFQNRLELRVDAGEKNYQNY